MPDEKTHLNPGSNEEKKDIVEPLPKEWTKESLADVTLHNSKLSPPCAKMRAVLSHYKIDFKIVEGPKKDSSYKKIPVLLVNGRQINDSHIMIKNLAPILDGKALSPELLEIEEIFTYGAMLSLERECASSCSDLCGCAGLIGCPLCIPLGCLSCCIPCFFPARISKNNPGLKSVEEYGQILKEKLGDKLFFHGKEAGIVDVSLYGGMLAFHQAKTAALENLLSQGLERWFDDMAVKVSYKIH